MILAIKKFLYGFYKYFVPDKPVYLLEMLWKGDKPFEESDIVNKNYIIRQFDQGQDLLKYQTLLQETEMGNCPLEYWNQHILPNGFFVVEHIPSGKIVGACFASHHPSVRHPFAGNLGWLAVHSEHRGIQMGKLLVERVVNRLIKSGYNRIYLETHDFRIAAIKLYFKTGWQPFIYNDDVSIRWRKICAQLNVDFNEKEWIITK